jgi:PAS domain S-box-containing protein
MVWTTGVNGHVHEDSPSWRAFTGQTYDEYKGSGWLNAVHPDDRAITLAAWREAVAGKTTYNAEYRLQTADGGYRWTSARGVPLLNDAGEVIEWVGMNADVTERRRAEEHANLIMRELSHRTKNLLAVIASLARRTFDGTRDVKTQSLDFVERIHGLARSHDLLVRGDWRGVSLSDLVHSHLEPFGFDAARVSIEGPSLTIKPEAAQSIGLALHELATNAIKHGGLKSANGHLNVHWRLAKDEGEPAVVLEWSEDTIADPTQAKSSGFGRTVLEQLVGASVGGSADYIFTDKHVVWRLRAPLSGIRAA